MEELTLSGVKSSCLKEIGVTTGQRLRCGHGTGSVLLTGRQKLLPLLARPRCFLLRLRESRCRCGSPQARASW